MVAGRREFRRTTSMTGITVDLSAVEQPASDFPVTAQNELRKSDESEMSMGGIGSPRHHTRRRSTNNILPHNNKNSSTEDTAHFLTMCGLCQRRLPPGRDIFMYRGDTAYCSVECREEQMKHDEKKEKCGTSIIHSSSVPSPAKDHHHDFPHHILNHSTAASAVNSDPAADKPGTLAAT